MAAPVMKQGMTLQDFAALDDAGFELVGGELVERNSSLCTSIVGGQIAFSIGKHVEEARLGHVYGPDLGVHIFANPDDVRKAKVLFLRAELTPKEDSDFLEVAPDLVVEVNAPDDLCQAVRKKVQLWLNAGVGAVWVAEPTSKEVTVYRRGETPIVFTAESDLTGGEALPGFVCKVERFFPQ